MTDTTSTNQAYFNKVAAEYDGKFVSILKQLEDELRNSRDFLGLPVGGRFLDYGCGTGFLSKAVGAQMSQCIGLDVSENMVGAYNAKAKSEGHPPESRVAYLGSLLDPADPAPAALSGPEFSGFDAVGISVALHHFDDPNMAARRLVERLRPGGVFLVLDFMEHGDHHGQHHGHHHGHGDLASHGVKHMGFSEERIRTLFKDAGAGADYGFKKLEEELVFKMPDGGEMKRTIFFARGKKA